jgi:hypothetical protein
VHGADHGASLTNEALTCAAMRLEAGRCRDAANNRHLALASALMRDELEPEPQTTELRT